MSVVVEVSARKFTVPHECACCSSTPDVQLAASYTRRTGKRVIRETTRSLDFPYCSRCAGHIAKWVAADALLGTLVFVSIVLAFIVGFGASGELGVGAFAVFFVLSLVLFSRARSRARALCGPTCATPELSVSHLGWSGSVSSFGFASDAYAAKFANANREKLVNLSMQLRRLLEQSQVVRTEIVARGSYPQVPAAASPPMHSAQSAHDVVLEWIARIEGYKGAEARRNALQRALAEVTDLEGRRTLVLAASRIEVAAVLEKVDTLASIAAKKRHLQKAIADIRADNIPDELQAEELRQLDHRLRELH